MSFRSALLKSAALSLLAASLASAGAKSWDVDKDHASVTFEVDHFFTPVKGRFTDFDGKFKLDEKDLTKSPEFEFVLKVDSVDTANEKRDKQLRSGDFFDAAKWNVIRFSGNSIVKTGDNTYRAIGRLQMRDVTRDFEVPITLLGVQKVKAGMLGKEIMGLRIQTDLHRGDFGVGTGSWAAAAVVGEKVSVDILLELK